MIFKNYLSEIICSILMPTMVFGKNTYHILYIDKNYETITIKNEYIT